MKDKRSGDINNIKWKSRLALLIKENPEIKKMTGKVALHLYKGSLCKVKIEEKEI